MWRTDAALPLAVYGPRLPATGLALFTSRPTSANPATVTECAPRQCRSVSASVAASVAAPGAFAMCTTMLRSCPMHGRGTLHEE